MAILAQLHTGEPASSRRRKSRRPLCLDVTGFGPGDCSFEARVHDLSSAGLLLATKAPFEVGDRFTLDTPHTGAVGVRVLWNRGTLFGCAFDRPLSAAGLSAAILRSAAAPIGALQPSIPAAPEAAGLSPRSRLLAILGLGAAAWAPILLVGQAALG